MNFLSVIWLDIAEQLFEIILMLFLLLVVYYFLQCPIKFTVVWTLRKWKIEIVFFHVGNLLLNDRGLFVSHGAGHTLELVMLLKSLLWWVNSYRRWVVVGCKGLHHGCGTLIVQVNPDWQQFQTIVLKIHHFGQLWFLRPLIEWQFIFLLFFFFLPL